MFMRAQRVRGGGSRIEMQDIKWTAEGVGKGFTGKQEEAEYSAT